MHFIRVLLIHVSPCSVLEVFGGNLKIVGPGASTEKKQVPHFPDDL